MSNLRAGICTGTVKSYTSFSSDFYYRRFLLHFSGNRNSSMNTWNVQNVRYVRAGPNGCMVYGVGLRPLAY